MGYDRLVAELVLFHHAQGLTPGTLSFVEDLRAAGHVVHVPDLYEGVVFDELSDGARHAEQLGFDTFIDRGRVAVEALPTGMVYAGFSLGVLPAQMLAQTRPGAKGALLFHSAVPLSEFSDSWPSGVPLQIHIMDTDPFALEGDLDVARQLDATVADAELFVYRGDKHLFTDSSTTDYDPAAARLVKQRVFSFLQRVE